MKLKGKSMLNKKIQTLRVILSTTINLWKAFGFSVAKPYFLKNIIFKKDNQIGKEYHTKQYENLKKVVRSKYLYIIEEFKKKELEKSLNADSKIENIIWMIWWQGITEDTPKTIVKNIERVQKLHPNWKVNVITKYNYNEFVDLPDHMESCIKKGVFSMTHISDYMRVALLENYGGIYLDCNFFLLKDLEFIRTYSFYTIKHGRVSKWHVSKGLWTTGFLAAGKNNLLFSFAKKMYEAFFFEYDFVPSYFFIDVIIGLGYENIESIKKEIDMVPYNNINYDFINKQGNEPFDDKRWIDIVDDTFVFNANYKNNFEYEKNEELTFFGHLYSESDD